MAGVSTPSLAAPAADLWDRWLPNSPLSPIIPDHSLWRDLLSRRVRRHPDGVTRFAYGSVTVDERANLDSYLGNLGRIGVAALARPQQLALWINLYNAVTVRTILAHYPVGSIRDIGISPGLFSRGPWGANLVEVDAVPVSLDDIEHRIIRPIWRDPRTHYAVNCAALGCPNLRESPWDGARIDTQLDEAAMAFVQHPRGMRFDQGRLLVSSLYRWYRVDFGDSDVSVLRHLMAYSAPPTAMALQRHSRIDGDTYDWSLNDDAA